MSQRLIAIAKAHIPGVGGASPTYPIVGRLLWDDSRKLLAVKLDTTPLDPTWTGWVNFFPTKETTDEDVATAVRSLRSVPSDVSDVTSL